MCLPVRCTRSMLAPSSKAVMARAGDFSGSGLLPIQTDSITSPVTRLAKPRAMVSTSGSSGMESSCRFSVLRTLYIFRKFRLHDDGNAADVDAQIARQRKNELQPLQIFFSIKAGVALGARRFEQALPLIEAQGLRMYLIHLGHRADHVRALGFAFCHRFSSSICLSILWRISANPPTEIEEFPVGYFESGRQIVVRRG